MPKSDLLLGIPGDGRCLFRSVVRGAHLREGKPSPCESHERELADELRAKVADEFIKRRADSEWFVEGDFDTYVRHMRQPQVWGGEPELLMSSHVLQAPITVHMWDKKTNCLKIIAEYGQEYGKESPIRVLYHGYGHYDALQSPFGSPKSKLNKRSTWLFSLQRMKICKIGKKKRRLLSISLKFKSYYHFLKLFYCSMNKSISAVGVAESRN
ncbi:OTU domain-containing protein At3g57810-like isoform X2 [Olea europaea var. sylvestris]|uniref:OTU domain-containing protein At3g57810-like isoform X2 n=1 Tax=Olea europaea var. sylvestris TaxID=158386 RepID=UPI000C1D31DD|nr:OTU domain-containing protein At3g57810-like isoform X2 [Olea europaea var. sylvestris]